MQELQLTTVDESNVVVYRTEGDTDQQAAALKLLFMDRQFVKQYNICSINSINIARIIAQSTYYIWVYLQLCPALDRAVHFIVPTGAFGNATAPQCGGTARHAMLHGGATGTNAWG